MFSLFKKKPQVFKDINLEEFNNLRSRDGFVVLDVRSPREVAAGAIPDHIAINVMAGSFREEVAKLDSSNTYLVYCKSGMRSAKACRIMAEMGFDKLYNFKGGMSVWQSQS